MNQIWYKPSIPCPFYHKNWYNFRSQWTSSSDRKTKYLGTNWYTVCHNRVFGELMYQTWYRPTSMSISPHNLIPFPIQRNTFCRLPATDGAGNRQISDEIGAGKFESGSESRVCSAMTREGKRTAPDNAELLGAAAVRSAGGASSFDSHRTMLNCKSPFTNVLVIHARHASQ